MGTFFSDVVLHNPYTYTLLWSTHLDLLPDGEGSGGCNFEKGVFRHFRHSATWRNVAKKNPSVQLSNSYIVDNKYITLEIDSEEESNYYNLRQGGGMAEVAEVAENDDVVQNGTNQFLPNLWVT